MKKTLIIMIIILHFLTPRLYGAIGSKGLILQSGASTIELQKGDKIHLTVQDGWSKRIKLKGLTFMSKNSMIASVEKHSGIIHANSIGRTIISVVDEDGDAGIIEIIVTKNSKKISLLPLFILLISILGLGIYLFKK